MEESIFYLHPIWRTSFLLLASLEFPSEAFRILSAPLKKYLQAQCQRLPHAMGDGAGGADKKYNVPIKGGLPLCTKLAFSMLIQIIDFKEHIFVQKKEWSVWETR